MYERFKRLLQEKGVRVTDVAQATGIAETNFSEWKAGRATPKFDRLCKIADYFGVSVDYFATGVMSKKPKRIPVFGYVAAGVPIEAQENIIDYEEISDDLARRGEYFALVIRGNSMQPRMFEGDVVIVRCQPDADSGDIVVALVNGDQGCVKKLIKYAHGIALQSLNEAYETRFFSEDEMKTTPVTIVGRVVEVRGKL